MWGFLADAATAQRTVPSPTPKRLAIVTRASPWPGHALYPGMCQVARSGSCWPAKTG
jgi:hypothetical protein